MIRKPRIIIALAMCLLAVLSIIPYAGAAKAIPSRLAQR